MKPENTTSWPPNYKDDSLLSRKIRKVAIEQFGGVEVEFTGSVTPVRPAADVPA